MRLRHLILLLLILLLGSSQNLAMAEAPKVLPPCRCAAYIFPYWSDKNYKVIKDNCSNRPPDPSKGCQNGCTISWNKQTYNLSCVIMYIPPIGDLNVQGLSKEAQEMGISCNPSESAVTDF